MAIGNARFKLQGASADVVITADGKEVVLLDTPWDALIKLGEAFIAAGRQCEEYAKANQVTFDQAILYRSGAPFAISAHPKILEEAKKEAVWNRELRRSNLSLVDSGVRSSEQVGVPVVTQGPPPGGIIAK